MINILRPDKKYLILLTVVVALFLVPFLKDPKYLTSKDNDLGRTYVGQFIFLKDTVQNYKQLPLWYPNQMMGQTYVSNPVSALFYPGNLIFLIMPVQVGVIVFYFLHLLLAAFGTYYLARSKNLAKPASFAAAVFYALSLKMLLHITAGHITMVAAFSLFPFLVLTITKLWQSPNFKWLSLSSILLTLIYFAYPTIAYYSAIFTVAYVIYKIASSPKKILRNRNLNISLVYFALFVLFTLGLSAIYLLPQMEFSDLSTRTSLKLQEIAIPIWNTQKFLSSLAFPYLSLNDLDHESLLYLGIIPTILAIFGFFKLSRGSKIAVGLSSLLAIIFVAGTSTPIFYIFYKFLPFLSYSRVTTRLWFVVILVVALLAAVFLNKLKNQKIVFVLVAIYLIEAGFIFYSKNISIPTLDFKDARIYQYLANNIGQYRAYCTSYCFNPQEIQTYNIDLLNGETPVQQKSFVDFLAKAGNYEFANFAVIFPPYQVWQVNEPPMPNLDLLSKANVKYVASTYPVKTSQLTQVEKFGKVYLYRNENVKNRAYFIENSDPVEITYESPNSSILKFPAKNFGRTLIYSQNYYPGWYYYNDNKKQEIEKFEEVFQRIKVAPATEEVILKYSPKSYNLGRAFTFGTIVLFVLLYIRERRKKSA